MATAHGGQVVLLLATSELACEAPVELLDLGEHRLPDLARPERVFQVVHKDLPIDFPGLRSFSQASSNLPLQLTVFVGREEELAEIAAALGSARVVTLTGIGGVGKTRAALQTADRDRPGQRPRVRDRRQRRDRQGRHLLPADGQEAPARPDDRGREPAALPLPRRLRRRVPADAGRGLPRPRALRPDLLQPGQPLGAGHPPDRQRDGLVHRRRRLRAGDERRVRDREEPGHDLPRRAAAGEGRDRRGRHRRGARRRRRARPHLRCRRPPRRRRRARARHRAVDRGHAAGGLDSARPPSEPTRSRSRTSHPRACTTWCPATPARRTTCAR